MVGRSSVDYRDWIITDHGHGCFHFCHKDYDLDDPRNGTVGSIEECKADIDEWEEENEEVRI